MAISILNFLPKHDVKIYSKSGEIFETDLNNDLVTVTTHRSTSGEAGTFALILVANVDSQGRSWIDRVSPMDYVAIRLGNQRNSDGTLPVRMRGFVDNIDEIWNIGQSGGPQRFIRINGRDFTKLFLVSNIQYLWTNTTLQSPIFAMNGYTGQGLSLNYHIDPSTSTVRQLLAQVVDKIYNDHFIPMFQQSGVAVNIPNIKTVCTVPDRYSINFITVESFTGPLWNLISYYKSDPFGELFFLDYESAPILMCRVAPFKDIQQNYVSPSINPRDTGGSQPSPIEVSPNMFISYDLGKSDNEVLNYFFVYSDIASQGAGTLPQYATMSENFQVYGSGEGGGNPYYNPTSVNTFGLRPLNIDSPWVPFAATGTGYVNNAQELAIWAGKVFGHNEMLTSGSITMHGDENIIPGRYLIVDQVIQVNGVSSKMAYYIQSVDETFNCIGSPTPGWTATVQVVRGYPFMVGGNTPANPNSNDTSSLLVTPSLSNSGLSEVTRASNGTVIPSVNSPSAFVAFVQSQEGKPYVYNTAGPGSFDCSGLVQYVFQHFGISIPRTSEQQYTACAEVANTNDMQVGDLCFSEFSYSGPNHVGIYIGNDTIVAAPHTGDVVKEYSPVSTFGSFQPARYQNMADYLAGS